jgi:hypothetical protein
VEKCNAALFVEREVEVVCWMLEALSQLLTLILFIATCFFFSVVKTFLKIFFN